VTSIEDAVSSISSGLEKAERLSGLPIEQVYVAISGSHIISQDSRGVVAVGKADGEINSDDVERVIEAAQAVATPPNYEILHVIPRSFIVDNQTGIKDPVGMTGVRLEVDAQIIQGLSTQINNLTKCIYRTGVEIEDLVLGILAASEAVLDKRQKELGVALVNIGGSTTSLAVFEEGDILHSSILPVGSLHVTNDIAIGLRTSVDVAEQLKINYGTCDPGGISKKHEIDLSEFSEIESGKVSHKHIVEITEARVEEIFRLVDEQLRKIERSGLLPAGVVFTGSGSKLDGLVDYAKRQLKLPASIGKNQAVISAIDKVNDISFSTALGLVVWGDNFQQQSTGGSILKKVKPQEMLGNMKNLFKKWIP
jgi:cell division protein FtsA